MNLTKITARIETHKVVTRSVHIDNVSLLFSLVKFITLRIKKVSYSESFGMLGTQGTLREAIGRIVKGRFCEASFLW